MILSPREREILTYTAAGMTQRAICEKLHLSIQTVKNQSRAIHEKLDTDNKVTAVLRGIKLGEIVFPSDNFINNIVYAPFIE